FTPALLHEKRGGEALCNAASAFFCAQPEGTGRISSSPSLLAAYGGPLRRAAHASCWMKSVAVTGVK
ncbi:MAG: hypothetical protein ABI167_10155, partial [Nitrosospira sp.]